MPRFSHPYFICMLACGAAAAFATVVLHESTLLRHADREAIHWRDAVAANERTLGALRDAETGQRGFLLTMQPDYLAPYRAGAKTVPELTHNLEDPCIAEARTRGASSS